MKTLPPTDDFAGAPESEPEVRPWRNIVLAARRARSCGIPEDEIVPYGFPARVVARWMEVSRDRALWIWQRWSVRAAAISVGLALVVVLAGRPVRGGGERLILPFPGLEVPLPTDNPASS